MFMEHRSDMKRQPATATRRAMAGVLLVTVLAGLIPWQGARAMACRMDRPVAPVAPVAPRCGSCGGDSQEAAGPSLEAGTCCRFAVPKEVSTLPAFTQTTPRAAGDDRIAAALPVEMHAASAIAAAVTARAVTSPGSSAPPSYSTHLRL